MPQTKFDAPQFVVACQMLQTGTIVQVRRLLVFPLSHILVPRTLQPVPAVVPTPGHVQLADPGEPEQLFGATHGAGAPDAMQPSLSFAHVTTPPLLGAQYVPAPALQTGSALHVHAAVGALPVQLWWTPQVMPPCWG
jgi:hypothetical protein